MRVLLDYRSALRGRSGVGEYAHQLVSALAGRFSPEAGQRRLALTVFSSSWKDRLQLAPEWAGLGHVDLRVPVRVLNYAWHRLEWPAIETLTALSLDVVHSMHPLLLPTRRAATVVTIHDLNFLKHPERTTAEIRRDYPSLVASHAARADRIIVSSRFAAQEIESALGIRTSRISVCPPGAPDWHPRAEESTGGYLLFFGTLEPRKNVGALLDAYEALLAAMPAADLPELVLAGRSTAEAAPWLERIARAPLAGRVRHLGYVDPADRRGLYEGARLLVQPSFEEGFGLPVLEAMTVGVPVVAANRGALPEVLGEAGALVDINPASLADGIRRMLTDDAFARRSAAAGITRARAFNWTSTADTVYEAYQLAIESRATRKGRSSPVRPEGV